jgi:hypothetical protein
MMPSTTDTELYISTVDDHFVVAHPALSDSGAAHLILSIDPDETDARHLILSPFEALRLGQQVIGAALDAMALSALPEVPC